MRTSEEFIRRIASRSGILTSNERQDLERELRAHLEDAAEEARSRGCDEATIFETVYARFGDPNEIARKLAAVYRFRRRAIILASAFALLAVSLLTVGRLIPALQPLIATCCGVSASDAFPHLPEENDHRRTQMITEPKIEHRDEQPYVGIRAQVTFQELGKVLPPLWGEVYGWLAGKGLKPAGAPLWRYRVIDMGAKMEIDVGVPVATPVKGDNRITADTLPAGRYATLIYTGPYEGLKQATADLLDWAQNKGIVWDKRTKGSTGESWRARIENYLTDPRAEPDSAKWQTELVFKLADDQKPG